MLVFRMLPENRREDVMLDICTKLIDRLEFDEISTEAELYAALEWEAFSYCKENMERINNGEPNPEWEYWQKLGEKIVEPVAETTTD